MWRLIGTKKGKEKRGGLGKERSTIDVKYVGLKACRSTGRTKDWKSLAASTVLFIFFYPLAARGCSRPGLVSALLKGIFKQHSRCVFKTQ